MESMAVTREGIARGVSLNCDLGVQNSMGQDWVVVKAFLRVLKDEWHSSMKCQGMPLWVRCMSGKVILEYP